MATIVAHSTVRTISTLLHSRRASLDAVAERRFVDFIRQAKRRLDIAAYDLRNAATLEALAEVSSRIALRIIIDAGEQTDDRFTDPKPKTMLDAIRAFGLESFVTIRGKVGEPIMHHRFAIRDDETIWTGSMLFTDGSLHLEDSGVLSFDSPELAARYTEEFNRLWHGATTPLSTPTEVQVGRGGKLTAFFGSEVRDALLRELREPGIRRLRLLLHSIGDVELLEALLPFRTQAIDFRGIYDTHGIRNTIELLGSVDDPRLWFLRDSRFVAAPSQAFHHWGESNGCTHKVFLINGLTLIGSSNFGPHPERRDESLLRLDSPQVMIAYTRYFDTLHRAYVEFHHHRSG